MPDVGGIAGERLRSFIERLERLDEEIKSLNSDKSEIYAEAKGVGFDTKIMREVIKLRKMDRDDRQERETLLDLYLQALGMIPGSDLTEAPSRVHVHIRACEEATKNDVPAAADTAGTESREGAPSPDPAGPQPEATADAPALQAAETAAHHVSAPLLTGAGGRRDSKSQPAGSDEGEGIAARSAFGADAPGEVEHRSADETAQGGTPQLSYTVPDDLTPAQKDGYIAHMNGEPGLAPEGYPDRRGWSQGYLRAMDDSRKASGADDTPFAVLPGAARGAVDQPRASEGLDFLAAS